jgi:predicted TIM-barrel enzyme
MRRVIADWPGVAPEELALLSPAMAGLPSGSASALALLPTHDANRDLFRVIEGHEAAPAELCAGVFAADPFLGLAEAFRRFVRAGIGRVANWPSVGLYDEPFRRELSSAGLGYEREIDFAMRASAAGFILTATAFDQATATRMIDSGAEQILLHPPLIDGRLMRCRDAVAWASGIAEAIAGAAEVLLYTEEAVEAGQGLPPSISGFVVLDA